MLTNVSLKARFYDRCIEFAIVKEGWGRTHLEVRFPARPHLRGGADLADFGSNNSNINSINNSNSNSNSNSGDPVFTSEPALSLGAFVAQPAAPPPRAEGAATISSSSSSGSGVNNSNGSSNKKAL
jgi:hypothetical protein